MSDNPFSYDSESDSANPFSVDQETGPEAGPTVGSGRMVNPYAPTTNAANLDLVGSTDEQVRNQYLSHEASVRSLGILYMIPGILFLVGAAVGFGFGVVDVIANGGDDGAGSMFVVTILYGGLGALYLYTGRGLRRLQKPARVIASIFSALGLLAIPLGTLISAYFLYLLLSEKGNVVFSPEYRGVVERTPHIKYKTSTVAKVVLGVFLLAVVGMLVSLFSFG